MNTSTSNNKVAIITGSSRGIGAAIAKRLAADGIAVIVNYAGRTADAEAVVSEIQENGGRAAAFQADVSVPAQVAAMFDQAITLFSGVDMLINTAGIMQQNVDLHRVLLLLAQRNTLLLKLMRVDSRCITPGPSSAPGSDLLFL